MSTTTIFENPIQAANELAQNINQEEIKEHIIICNSVKNIPFVDTFANITCNYYDMLFTKGIYTPNKECQLAKVSESDEVVYVKELIEYFNISKEYLNNEIKLAYNEDIRQKISYFRKHKSISNLKNKDILILDQGSNTGLTLNVCHKSLINLGVKSIKYATSIISSQSYDYFNEIFDNIYYLYKLDHFINKDFYYEETLNIANEFALEILEESDYYLPFITKELDEKKHYY